MILYILGIYSLIITLVLQFYSRMKFILGILLYYGGLCSLLPYSRQVSNNLGGICSNVSMKMEVPIGIYSRCLKSFNE